MKWEHQIVIELISGHSEVMSLQRELIDQLTPLNSPFDGLKAEE